MSVASEPKSLTEPGPSAALSKRNWLFIVLAGVFITNALLAEIIGAKIFSLEGTLGVDPAGLSLFGFTFDFNMSAGTVLWPVVFVTTDLVNEYFGKRGVQRVSFLTVALIAYAFFALFCAVQLSPASFWLEVNARDPNGNAFDINYAFQQLFGQGMRIIVASLTAFLVSQLVDVYVFQKLKERTGGRQLWLRATGSTVVSQLVDTYVVAFVAFGGIFPVSQLIAMGFVGYMVKFAIAIAMTPVLYGVHMIIDRYLEIAPATPSVEPSVTSGAA